MSTPASRNRMTTAEVRRITTHKQLRRQHNSSSYMQYTTAFSARNWWPVNQAIGGLLISAAECGGLDQHVEQLNSTECHTISW
jgi:hypothetical protein